jgi:WD40 repeat protein
MTIHLKSGIWRPGWKFERLRGIPAVSAVSVTADGRRVISASYDNTLKVWDIETGMKIRTLKGHTDGVRAVSVTPDGRCAISASYDNTLKPVFRSF